MKKECFCAYVYPHVCEYCTRRDRTKWKKSTVRAFAVRNWRGIIKSQIRHSEREIKQAYKLVYNQPFSARKGLKIVEVLVREI